VFGTAALDPVDWLKAVAVASSVLLLDEARKAGSHLFQKRQ
jgi:hypothetical protein